MRKIHLFLVSVLVLTAILTLTAKAEEVIVPPGMEIIRIQGVRYLVPKGSKVRKSGGVILFEGVDEYMVNKFVELDKRLAAMEKEIEQLKRVLGETQIGVQQLLNR
jgi:uncharacterized small protein (DUF1192 family)